MSGENEQPSSEGRVHRSEELMNERNGRPDTPAGSTVTLQRANQVRENLTDCVQTIIMLLDG